MDLIDFKLRRLEEDYQATIEADERAQYNQIDSPVLAGEETISHAIEDEYLRVRDDISTPALIEPVPYKPRETRPLDPEEVEGIKTHMKTIKLNYEPTWAKSVSDEKLVSMLKRVLIDS